MRPAVVAALQDLLRLIMSLLKHKGPCPELAMPGQTPSFDLLSFGPAEADDESAETQGPLSSAVNAWSTLKL